MSPQSHNSRMWIKPRYISPTSLGHLGPKDRLLGECLINYNNAMVTWQGYGKVKMTESIGSLPQQKWTILKYWNSRN